MNIQGMGNELWLLVLQTMPPYNLSDEQPLYHFTNLAALESILEHDEMRLYQRAGKKDESEFLHGIEILEQELRKKSGLLFRNMHSQIEKTLQHFHNSDSEGPLFFASCLTDQKTCRHWIEYAQPYDQGVCIELKLERGLIGGFYVSRVCYSDDKIGLIRQYLDGLKEDQHPCYPHLCNESAWPLIGITKRVDFDWEKEWRLFSRPTETYAKHLGEDCRGRYVPFRDVRPFISRILPGPSASKKTKDYIGTLEKKYSIPISSDAGCFGMPA